MELISKRVKGNRDALMCFLAAAQDKTMLLNWAIGTWDNKILIDRIIEEAEESPHLDGLQTTAVRAIVTMIANWEEDLEGVASDAFTLLSLAIPKGSLGKIGGNAPATLYTVVLSQDDLDRLVDMGLCATRYLEATLADNSKYKGIIGDLRGMQA